MALDDLATSQKVIQLLSSAKRTTGTYYSEGYGVRMAHQVAVILNVGTASSQCSMQLTVQESSDGSEWTDVPSAAFTTITGLSDDTHQRACIMCARVAGKLRVKSVVSSGNVHFGVMAAMNVKDSLSHTAPDIQIH